MTPATIARYQNGGDLYQAYFLQYGQVGADAIAAAAATGDNNGEVAQAIAQAKYGDPANESILDAFGNNLIDPDNPYSLQNFVGTEAGGLASGISSNAENALETATASLFRSPLFLGALVLGGVIYFGGGDWIKNQLKSAFK